MSPSLRPHTSRSATLESQAEALILRARQQAQSAGGEDLEQFRLELERWAREERGTERFTRTLARLPQSFHPGVVGAVPAPLAAARSLRNWLLRHGSEAALVSWFQNPAISDELRAEMRDAAVERADKLLQQEATEDMARLLRSLRPLQNQPGLLEREHLRRLLYRVDPSGLLYRPSMQARGYLADELSHFQCLTSDDLAHLWQFVRRHVVTRRSRTLWGRFEDGPRGEAVERVFLHPRATPPLWLDMAAEMSEVVQQALAEIAARPELREDRERTRLFKQHGRADVQAALLASESDAFFLLQLRHALLTSSEKTMNYLESHPPVLRRLSSETLSKLLQDPDAEVRLRAMPLVQLLSAAQTSERAPAGRARS